VASLVAGVKPLPRTESFDPVLPSVSGARLVSGSTADHGVSNAVSGARMRAFVRVSGVAGVLGLAAMWLRSAWLWRHLPDRIPLHFDLVGRPDRWGETTALGWFGLPITFTVLSVFVVGLGALVWMLEMRRPGTIDVPSKQAFAALPTEARARAMRPLAALGLAMPVVFAVIVMDLQDSMYASAMDPAAPASGLLALWIATAASLVWIGLCLHLFSRCARAEVAATRSTPGAGPGT
jgi:hypothetical protein